jgi:hypothetical protein
MMRKKHYDLRKSRIAPRYGIVFTRKNKWGRLPANLDIYLGNHLFAFWKKSSKTVSKLS